MATSSWQTRDRNGSTLTVLRNDEGDVKAEIYPSGRQLELDEVDRRKLANFLTGDL